MKNQNLHISQTYSYATDLISLFWRIKIYISLKLVQWLKMFLTGFEESKFTYLSNFSSSCLVTKLVLKNQNLHISQTVKYAPSTSNKFWRIKIYISLKQYKRLFHHITSFEESKFTYLSNIATSFFYSSNVLKNQNLHISQTLEVHHIIKFRFWRIKIYISLKQGTLREDKCNGFEESKFTYLSNQRASRDHCR